MSISLDGTWKVQIFKEGGCLETEISLPGTINGSGLGDPISADTQWNSGLHNPFWQEREEYKSGTEGDYHVPFLSQPKSFFAGEARYERSIKISQAEAGSFYLFLELSKWKLTVYVDGGCVGSEESLCAPFVFGPFELKEGEHTLTICVDNRMQYPYRPDGHGISDALGANWNGIGGEMTLFSATEWEAREQEKHSYATKHSVSVTTGNRAIIINGKPEYMRGTHFGGDFPLTGVPSVEKSYWEKLFATIKEWGFNFMRCHSYCPPEAAFLAADEAGIYIQVECGMWNTFGPGNPILTVLEKETRKILEAFGHHPSFVLFSPSNEPGGNWYQVLRDWVSMAREIDKELGYEGRRVYTAQSGWFYDVPPAKVEGTDYLYFHRSAFGPIHGGMIRNSWGWNGKDYSPSLEGSTLPIISHEMGQWCSYPDFDVIEKFTGYAKPGNYEIFRESARKNDVLQFNKEFVYCSGRNQVRLLKEEFEANFRTPELTGYEYLDLHDYTGQGTAQVGILDAFWENKGYVMPEEFKKFNSDVVLLSRMKSYVLCATDRFEASMELCNFGKQEISTVVLCWKLMDERSGKVLACGEQEAGQASLGETTKLGKISCDLTNINWCGLAEEENGESLPESFSRRVRFCVTALGNEKEQVAENDWELTVFVPKPDREEVSGGESAAESGGESSTVTDRPKRMDFTDGKVLYTKSLEEAMEALKAGKNVLLTPYMSDMDFECPNLSIKNVFWNAQMGPRWSRELGIVVEEKHPIFRTFATGHAGGWEWENILENARGFHFPAKYPAIVRVIDEWNRNYPLSLIFEGRVLNGKLLFVAADLSGDFATRPAAETLKNALLSYMASEEFDPKTEIKPEDLQKHLRPLYRNSDIIQKVTVNGEEREECMNCYDINPNIPFIDKPEQLPVVFEFVLRRPVKVTRLSYLPIQNDRDFLGVIREYEIAVRDTKTVGEFKNGFETQWTQEIGLVTDHLTLTVYSTYSMGEAVRFVEENGGWHRKKGMEPLVVSVANFGVEYEEVSESAGVSEEYDALEASKCAEEKQEYKRTTKVRHTDDHFWSGAAISRHKEIDL